MTTRPNVLLITCDQWRGDSLSAAGHPVVKTPAADALASEGVMFRRHYAAAAPCSPARACLYTGLYQMNNRVCGNGTPLDARHLNMARLARRAGYDPTLFGYTDVSPDPKLHAPDDPALKTYEGFLPGFSVRQALPEHQRPWLSWLAQRGHDVSAGYPGIHHPRTGLSKKITAEPPIYARDETPAAFLTGEFIRWLGEQDAGWFAHISFLSPHPPFVVPEPFNTMYAPEDGDAFRRAPSVDAETSLHPFLAYDIPARRKDSFVPGHGGRVIDWSEQEHRRIRALYWGMVSEVDSQLGRVWQAIRDAGAWDDTIIILTSDHAEMLGDHYQFGKGGFHDGSYHLPLIIRDPRADAAAGTTVDAFTEAVDVLPTLLDLIQAPAQPHLDGHSLAPFLAGEQPTVWRDAAHWEFDFRSISSARAENHFRFEPRRCNLAVIRSERFKYVHFAGLPPLLFDLTEDPDELRNVAGDPAYAAARIDMAERLLAWRAAHLDQSLALAELTETGVTGFFAS
ncbi:MAG: alkaline phosphatase family protein [Rhizobiaceae bacterium]